MDNWELMQLQLQQGWQQDDDEESQVQNYDVHQNNDASTLVSSSSSNTIFSNGDYSNSLNATLSSLSNATGGLNGASSVVAGPVPLILNPQHHVNLALRIHQQPLAIFDRVTTDIPTSDQILYAGLIYAGFGPERQQRNNLQRNINRFKSFYGVEPTTVAPYLECMKDKYPDITYKYCLLTMNWLFGYDTYPVLSGRWDYCEETIGEIVIKYGLMMANIGRSKIVFQLNDDIELGRTVDCATFMTNEMRQDPSSIWYDPKTHSCGLKWEFSLATREPRVTWMRGPFPASIHDITVFRGGDPGTRLEDRDQSALYFQLGENEKLIGDAGYAGEPSKIVVTRDEHSSEFKEFLARAKNRQETFHWRLKSFNILGHRFRHGVGSEDRMRLHKMAVEAVAGIVQTDYDQGHEPFDIV